MKTHFPQGLKVSKVIIKWEACIKKIKAAAGIVAALKTYYTQVHPAGESLSYSTRIYRVNVVTMLKAGVPLSKIVCGTLCDNKEKIFGGQFLSI